MIKLYCAIIEVRRRMEMETVKTSERVNPSAIYGNLWCISFGAIRVCRYMFNQLNLLYIIPVGVLD
jgi:hypothetical protein